MEHSGGWIKALLEEAENERMHLMTFVEITKPRLWERALVFTVQVSRKKGQQTAVWLH